MQTVLVTGAGGSVGNYAVSLLEAAGYAVVANDLPQRKVRAPTRGHVVAGDLCDPEVRAKCLNGVNHVIHTAALLDATADAAELGRVNTDLVAALYQSAAEAGAERFVHMSSCMLYARGQSGKLDEEAATAPRGPHGLSKLGAEAFLRGRGTSAGPAWTILRAGPIYGRRGRHFAASLLVLGPLLRLATPLLPALRGGARHNFAHAEDVARALVFALREPRTKYGTYNVADDDPMPLGDRMTLTFQAYGLRTMPGGSLPPWLLELAAMAARTPGSIRAVDTVVLNLWKAVVLRHGLKPALRPRLDREAVTLLDDDLQVDSSRLRALGFEGKHGSFATGWRGVLRWYQAERWVPRY